MHARRVAKPRTLIPSCSFHKARTNLHSNTLYCRTYAASDGYLLAVALLSSFCTLCGDVLIRRSFECGSLRPWGPRRTGTASILLPPAITGMFALRAMLWLRTIVVALCVATASSSEHCILRLCVSSHEEKGVQTVLLFEKKIDCHLTYLSVRHHVQT